MPETVGELVRKAENDFIRGSTQISKYVNHSLHDTLETIDAYLNSVHISGETDNLGREKPFFNISKAAVNVWFRATDIDRKDIKIRASKAQDWVLSFLATVKLREWMRKENFGTFLNDWGRSLARYGSSVVKFVKNSSGLHISVVPWNRLIVDAVDFDANPKIELLELTMGQLRARVQTHGYDKEQVDDLESALTTRDTLDRTKKDTKADYVKLYEVHGLLPKSLVTGNETDNDTYVQQMHVISYVQSGKGRKAEYEDFTLYSGEEERDPYMITHLIREDGRTLSIGAVESLFQAQWMINHSVKQIKDTLDLTSKLIMQTADAGMLGRNALTDMETGTILVHKPNMPLTQVSNTKLDITQSQNFAMMWKQVGNEIVGVSDAMLGAQPKSGTAWRQTEALLQENYSLFEVMTENKGLHIIDMLTDRILPQLMTELDTSDEVAAVLESYEIHKLDSIYVPSAAIRRFNERTKNDVLDGKLVQPFDAATEQAAVQQSLQPLGNQRFFKPSDIDDATWKEAFKDFEWQAEIDVTGEGFDVQSALTTLNTALQLVVMPGFDQNKRAQALVGRVLELTGAMSPLEYGALPNSTMAAPLPPTQPGNPNLTPSFAGSTGA